jgi:hypothetical protein
MKERTAFRLAMLRNGYQPTLNDCKRAKQTGWPRHVVDEAEILEWDRSIYASTGMKVDADLGVFDVDVPDASLVVRFGDLINARFPELFMHCLVRHAGGAKEAWIARVTTPFTRRASRKWYRSGEDPENTETLKYQVECFGSLGPRQIGVHGPHARNRAGEVVSVYQFTDGASPATQPRGSLCVLPLDAFETACNEFDRIAAEAGLTAVKNSDRDGGRNATRRFELDADTEIDVQSYGIMSVRELERFVRPGKGQRITSLRCSGSFHDETRKRTDSHLISWGRHGLSIWDAMTDVTWHRRERAPSQHFEFLQDLLTKSFNHEHV